ncbi:unnamed protein product [Prorocentrum cordatum]|uniref:Uncharacterized protein n=1 Tax=Prorocentrum cordatum TaxID=2364126 RepID=A0ABN9P6E3_9DINO|nr:unnamed protein product [Polarella glacialis]
MAATGLLASTCGSTAPSHEGRGGGAAATERGQGVGRQYLDPSTIPGHAHPGPRSDVYAFLEGAPWPHGEEAERPAGHVRHEALQLRPPSCRGRWSRNGTTRATRAQTPAPGGRRRAGGPSAAAAAVAAAHERRCDGQARRWQAGEQKRAERQRLQAYGAAPAPQEVHGAPAPVAGIGGEGGGAGGGGGGGERGEGEREGTGGERGRGRGRSLLLHEGAQMPLETGVIH